MKHYFHIIATNITKSKMCNLNLNIFGIFFFYQKFIFNQAILVWVSDNFFMGLSLDRTNLHRLGMSEPEIILRKFTTNSSILIAQLLSTKPYIASSMIFSSWFETFWIIKRITIKSQCICILKLSSHRKWEKKL